MDNISQSCLIPWRAGKCLVAALWTLCQCEKQTHHRLSTGKSLHLSALSRETQILGSIVSRLFLHLADFGTRSFIHCKVHKWCSMCVNPVCLVFHCTFLPYLPGGDGEVLLWFLLIVPTLSIPKGIVYQSVKVMSLLLCVEVIFIPL